MRRLPVGLRYLRRKALKALPGFDKLGSLCQDREHREAGSHQILHVYYGSFAAGVGMDATTPSPFDLMGFPMGSTEALPKALRLANTERVDPTYRELEAGENWTSSRRKNKRCLNWQGVICRLRPAPKRKSQDLIPNTHDSEEGTEEGSRWAFGKTQSC